MYTKKTIKFITIFLCVAMLLSIPTFASSPNNAVNSSQTKTVRFTLSKSNVDSAKLVASYECYQISELTSSITMAITDITQDETYATLVWRMNNHVYVIVMHGHVVQVPVVGGTAYQGRFSGTFMPQVADATLCRVSNEATDVLASVTYASDGQPFVSLTCGALGETAPMVINYGTYTSSVGIAIKAYVSQQTASNNFSATSKNNSPASPLRTDPDPSDTPVATRPVFQDIANITASQKNIGNISFFCPNYASASNSSLFSAKLNTNISGINDYTERVLIGQSNMSQINGIVTQAKFDCDSLPSSFQPGDTITAYAKAKMELECTIAYTDETTYIVPYATSYGVANGSFDLYSTLSDIPQV